MQYTVNVLKHVIHKLMPIDNTQPITRNCSSVNITSIYTAKSKYKKNLFIYKSMYL